jgi:hypothetical protein
MRVQITKSSDAPYTPSQVTNQLVMSFDTVADGVIDAHDPTGAEVTPLTEAYYLTHDAGIKDMKRWLEETDKQISARRDTFMSFLRSNFSVDLPTDLPPEAKWLENGFWGIVPYTESHNTDSRIVTGVGVDNQPVQFNLSRIIEVGFKFSSHQGIIKQGVYLFENCTDLASPALPCACLSVNPVINFRTYQPSKVNELNQAFIHEHVSLRDYPGCTGMYQVGLRIVIPCIVDRESPRSTEPRSSETDSDAPICWCYDRLCRFRTRATRTLRRCTTASWGRSSSSAARKLCKTATWPTASGASCRHVGDDGAGNHR